MTRQQIVQTLLYRDPDARTRLGSQKDLVNGPYILDLFDPVQNLAGLAVQISHALAEVIEFFLNPPERPFPDFRCWHAYVVPLKIRLLAHRNSKRWKCFAACQSLS